MLVISLVYNVILVALGLAAVMWFHRKPGVVRTMTAMLVVSAGVVLLAAVMAVDRFAFFRLLSFGIFGHCAFLLLASSVYLWIPSRALAVLCGVAALGLWGIALDAFLIEPTWLQVSHRQLTSEKIDRPLRIVVMADIQADRFGEYEYRAVQRAMEQKPHLLLFAGDYVQCWDAQLRKAVQQQLNRCLRTSDIPVDARLFAVSGNVDDETWPDIFAGLDAAIAGTTQTFELGDVSITCLGFEDSRRTDVAIEDPRPGRYHIVLGHSPNFALGRIEGDLLLAGHTHGGQVRLPFLGPLMTLSHVPRSWAAGMTELPGGGRLIVSRGIGMERGHAPRLRFLCRPELVVIDLVPESGAIDAGESAARRDTGRPRTAAATTAVACRTKSVPGSAAISKKRHH